MVSASQSLGDLVSTLRRAGWGPIAGKKNRAARAVLDALASTAKWAGTDRAGNVVITQRQLADYSGYCDRHLRRWMPVLEDLGLIEWHRGGVVEGRPRPGVLRVVKRVLVQWIKDARPSNDKRIEARRRETAERLAKLRNLRIPPYRRNGSAHADMKSSLPPYRGRTGRPARPANPGKNALTPRKETQTMSQVTLDITQSRSLPPEDCLPLVCTHSASVPRFCNACRSLGWQRHQEYERVRLAAEKKALDEDAERARQAALPTPYEEYMRATYPGVHPRQWWKLNRDDSTARELARV